MKMKHDNTGPLTTGRLIEAVMRYRGMDYKGLGAAIGWHPMNVCKLLNGRKDVTPAIAIRIADALRMSPPVIMQSISVEILGKRDRKQPLQDPKATDL